MKKIGTLAFSLLLSLALFAGENTKVKMSVKGMHCGGCENKVKSVLTNLEGVVSVESVSAELSSAELTIDKSVTTEEKVALQLAEKTGYEVGLLNIDGTAKTTTKSCNKGKKGCCQSGATTPACKQGEQGK